MDDDFEYRLEDVGVDACDDDASINFGSVAVVAVAEDDDDDLP